MASINIKKDGQWTGKPVLGFKVGEENLTDDLKEKIANGADVDLSDYATKDELNALTAEDIGAAPAGYGLGLTVKDITASNLDSTTSNGWYRIAGDSLTIGGYTYSDWHIHVSKYSTKNLAQEMYTLNGYKAVRRCQNGTWHEEWENPPMSVGVEYRTTERWNGKVVYTKLVSYGGMPNSNRYAVAHGASATQILRCVGMNITTGMNIPCDTISVFADKTNITIITTADHRSHKSYVQIWYTKD